MNAPGNPPAGAAELQFALAEADGVEPPADLAHRLEQAALRQRVARRPVDPPEPLTPFEVFAESVASMDGVLSSLGDDEWARSSIRDLTVQGLVGHLIGVERALAAAIVSPAADAGDGLTLGHVEGTTAAADAQRGRRPAETLDDWREAVTATLDLIRPMAAEPDGLSSVVMLHELSLTLEVLLVVRAFELWTHEEDVRRATGRPLAPPSAASVYAMTSLAVSFLPLVLEPDSLGRRVSLVFTGEGGGTWHLGTAEGVDQSPDVRIVADVVDFCRVVADRIDPADFGYHVDGDPDLARRVLEAASTLALD